MSKAGKNGGRKPGGLTKEERVVARQWRTGAALLGLAIETLKDAREQYREGRVDEYNARLVRVQEYIKQVAVGH